MNSFKLWQGDIGLTRGVKRLARIIRVCQRSKGELPSIVNHALTSADYQIGKCAMIIEALDTVKYHDLYERYGDTSEMVSMFRHRHLTDSQRRAVAEKAKSYVGRKYGYLKIGAHLGDYGLSRLFGHEVYFCRRIAGIDKYPICSWVVAFAYAEIGVLFLGKKPGFVEPDDIWDEVTKHPETWENVLPLSYLARSDV
jgi:hypothetical protein